MKRLLLFVLLAVVVVSLVIVPTQQAIAETTDDFFDRLGDLFLPQSNKGTVNEQVYIGGHALGMTIDGNGVTVIGLNEFFNNEGKLVCPAVEAKLQLHDVIIQLDGKNIYSSTKLSEIATSSEGEPLKVKYIRQGKTEETVITPQLDLSTKQYRLGLWTKDSSSGIGTLTYIRKDLSFGSLGHPICDSNSSIVDCGNGAVYRCKINGVNKGTKGTAGELKGNFSFEDNLGTLYKNNKFGAFGTFNAMPFDDMELIDVASVGEVHPGKAYIYSTISGSTRQRYSIEIIKATHQTSPQDKGMVLRVTDERLLQTTGGIVQGMSGSPIIQDGKLVGAVTHVFVNDPTKGYGMFAEWMLKN